MKTIALFFGGLSEEAEVSVMSAKNVVKYFDYRRYKLILIYWHKKDCQFYKVKNINHIAPSAKDRIRIEDFSTLFNVALLMTHGRYGEDGVLQAILESQKIKYCGSRVLSSALCMDKAVFKNLMSAAKIKQVKYIILDYTTMSMAELHAGESEIKKIFRLPLFVKPANSGSSIGITKVEKYSDLAVAIKEAKKYDRKILVEAGIVNPQEIEVAVMGNKKLIISRPGELKLVKDFYDYDAKYKLGEAKVVVPANISRVQAGKIRKIAAQAYRLAGCQGFARVDFFVAKNKIYLSEINTIPGFTDISMFPLLMMNLGMSYQELINKIIKLAE